MTVFSIDATIPYDTFISYEVDMHLTVQLFSDPAAQ